MNIKEYIKLQAEKSEDKLVQIVFLDLKEKFFPKPIEKKSSIGFDLTQKPKIKKSISDRVLVRKKGSENIYNNAIGTIKSNNDIDLNDGSSMIFQLTDTEGTYYTYLGDFYYKDKNSKIVNKIEDVESEKHKANISMIKEYILKKVY